MSKSAKRGDQKTQEHIRKRAVKAVVEKGHKPALVAEAFGVALNTVYKWVRMYKSSGSSALKNAKRGCTKGSRSSLTAHQCKEIQRLIKDTHPEQLKMPFVLWTRKAVQELIEDQFSIKMPIRTVGEYLSRWDFTPQKPLKKSYEQQPKAVQKWLADEYPAIKKEAEKESAEIHWGDETGCTNKISHGRSYAPKGQTPTIVLSTKKKLKINMISSVSNQGKVFFDIHEGKINSAQFIEFMKKLIRCTDKKVYFIVDNLPQHRSKIVRDWLSKNEDAIKLFYLPSYSPELNPDEYLNCELKRSLNSKRMPLSNSQLKDNTTKYMIELSSNSKKVKSYFRHPKVKYAS